MHSLIFKATRLWALVLGRLSPASAASETVSCHVLFGVSINHERIHQGRDLDLTSEAETSTGLKPKASFINIQSILMGHKAMRLGPCWAGLWAQNSCPSSWWRTSTTMTKTKTKHQNIEPHLWMELCSAVPPLLLELPYDPFVKLKWKGNSQGQKKNR